MIDVARGGRGDGEVRHGSGLACHMRAHDAARLLWSMAFAACAGEGALVEKLARVLAPQANHAINRSENREA